jgi:DNA-directed RNA polymerase subunit RPC12/RpoP
MSLSTYRCTCGATLRFKQDLAKEQATTRPRWKCRDCGTPVPGQIAEKLRHQHPS